jgi:hypothetical protein
MENSTKRIPYRHEVQRFLRNHTLDIVKKLKEYSNKNEWLNYFIETRILYEMIDSWSRWLMFDKDDQYYFDILKSIRLEVYSTFKQLFELRKNNDINNERHCWHAIRKLVGVSITLYNLEYSAPGARSNTVLWEEQQNAFKIAGIDIAKEYFDSDNI